MTPAGHVFVYLSMLCNETMCFGAKSLQGGKHPKQAGNRQAFQAACLFNLDCSECSWFCADAWNMLYGAAQENWETEAQLDELHAAATNAKRNIETISKVSCPDHCKGSWILASKTPSYLKIAT